MGFESRAADLLADAIVKTADTKGARKRRELLDRVLFALGGGLAGYTAFSVAKDPPQLLRDAGAKLGKLAAQTWRPSRLGGTPPPVAPAPKPPAPPPAPPPDQAADNVGGTRLEAAGRFGDSAVNVAGRAANVVGRAVGGYYLGGRTVPWLMDSWDFWQSRRPVERTPDQLLARIGALEQNIGREQARPEAGGSSGNASKKPPGNKQVLDPKLTITPPPPLSAEEVVGLAKPPARRAETRLGQLISGELNDPAYARTTAAGKYFRRFGVPPALSENIGHTRQVFDALNAVRHAAETHSVKPVEVLTSATLLARQAREVAAAQGVDPRVVYKSRLGELAAATEALQRPDVGRALSTGNIELPLALRTHLNVADAAQPVASNKIRTDLGRVAAGQPIGGGKVPTPKVTQQAADLRRTLSDVKQVSKTLDTINAPATVRNQPAAARSFLQATDDALPGVQKAFITPRTPPKRVTVGGRRLGGAVGMLAGLLAPYAARKVTNVFRGSETAAERTLK
jgi:hypothetical protein